MLLGLFLGAGSCSRGGFSVLVLVAEVGSQRWSQSLALVFVPRRSQGLVAAGISSRDCFLLLGLFLGAVACSRGGFWVLVCVAEVVFRRWSQGLVLVFVPEAGGHSGHC